MRIASVVCSLSLVVAGAFHAEVARAQATRLMVAVRAAPDSLITLPANTRIFARLERRFSTRFNHPGDTVLLRSTHPVLVRNRVIIPAGTSIQATLLSAAAHGSAPVRLALRVDRLIFSNGYVATAAIPGRAVSDDGTLQVAEPGTAAQLVGGVGAPVGGALLGGAIGAAAGGREGAFVGGGVGGLAALAIVAAVAGHHSAQALEAGSPIDLELGGDLTLDLRRAASAPASADLDERGRAAARAAACRRGTVTTTGTPTMTIPGTPGMPAMGDMPATPGTPDVIIPGTPSLTTRPPGCRE